ncbi:MAG: 3-hydroxyacyl-ACP dehydratase FabZ [Burkholderiales bacterium]
MNSTLPRAATIAEAPLFGPAEIRATILHRDPFVLIDSILAYEPDVRCVAQKYVDPADPVFAGHFPEMPVMPGVHILENMAQTACFLIARTDKARGDADARTLYVLARINHCTFSRMALPGDTLNTEVKVMRKFDRLTILDCTVTVDGNVIAKSELVVTRSRSQPAAAATSIDKEVRA